MAAEIHDYRSLTAQVAEKIVREIRGGTWIAALPSERVLAQMLRVSRKTLRKAIVQLEGDGVIQSRLRLGHRIVSRPPVSAHQELAIGLLTPEPLDQLASHTALWVDELRALLFGTGVRFAAFSSARFFSHGSHEALARLVRQNPHSCWVLTHSDEPMQRWFAEQRIPCVIAGSCHRGLLLPNVDFDYFAVCRHAVGAMLRLGHQRLAFMCQESQRPGDLESVAGFMDGVQRSGRTEITATVSRHDGSVEGVWRTLGRLFELHSPPTALLVAKPVFYLTAVTFLAERGLRVGADVSLVSRDHEPFLSYLMPTPAGYSFSPNLYARRLYPLVLALARHESIARLNHRIEPKFVAGRSLAPRKP